MKNCFVLKHRNYILYCIVKILCQNGENVFYKKILTLKNKFAENHNLNVQISVS